jgi:uncharacterized DUF497 family protein
VAFEWDERKRLANLEKHGIDFAAAGRIFEGPTVEFPDRRHDYGEVRVGALGEVEGRVLFVVYTLRGGKRRLISARKAGQLEREMYGASVAGGALDDDGPN